LFMNWGAIQERVGPEPLNRCREVTDKGRCAWQNGQIDANK
jgi:hypothetical protein